MKCTFDKWMPFIGLLGPIMTMPQLFKVWMEKDASSLSLATWITYLMLALFWSSYGYLHKQKPLIITFSIYIFIHSFIVFGIVVYS